MPTPARIWHTICTPLEETVLLPGVVARVRTGMAAVYEDGSPQRWGLLIRDRSSMAAKGVFVSGGVVDAGYRGEILVLLTLGGMVSWTVRKGDKIAQMIPLAVMTGRGVMEVEELPPAVRGNNGFGSTGR